MSGRAIPFLILLASLSNVPSARADEIRLKDGTKISGTIVGFENDSFRVETSYELIEQIPEECLTVAESGLRSHDDLKSLRAAGFDAFLIGEHLMLSPDPGAALRTLLVPPASGG